MTSKYHFVIRFSDLSSDKQMEIQEAVSNNTRKDNEEYLLEVCGSDPYDIDRPDADRISEHVYGCVKKALDTSWTELEVEVRL